MVVDHTLLGECSRRNDSWVSGPGARTGNVVFSVGLQGVGSTSYPMSEGFKSSEGLTVTGSFGLVNEILLVGRDVMEVDVDIKEGSGELNIKWICSVRYNVLEVESVGVQTRQGVFAPLYTWHPHECS